VKGRVSEGRKVEVEKEESKRKRRDVKGKEGREDGRKNEKREIENNWEDRRKD
jgi:hypothetical protein